MADTMSASEGIAILRPSAVDALEAWRAIAEANHEQTARLAPSRVGSDVWASLADQFRPAGRTGRAPILPLVEELARPEDSWLDIGAGAGAFALPLAQQVQRVLAIEPSAAMAELLREGVHDAGLDNVEVLPSEPWPSGKPVEPVDVVLASHVVYFVAEIGPFLDAMEAHARRLCVAAVGDRPGSTPPDDLWPDLHDELQAQGPGLPEFLAVLSARGTPFEVRTVEQPTTSVPSVPLERQIAMQRHKCLVEQGTPLDERLRTLIIERYSNADGTTRAESAFRHVSVVSWRPPRRG